MNVNGLPGASGAMYLGLGGGDTFEKDIFIDNQSTASFQLAFTTGTSQFNGNVVVSGTSGSINFGTVGGASQLVLGKSIIEGTSGLNGTTLSLANVDIPDNLTLDAPQSVIYLGRSNNFNGYYYNHGSQFHGQVNVTANTIIAYQSTFDQETTLNKAGTANYTFQSPAWGNTFKKQLNVNGLPGSGGGMYLGYGGADIYKDKLVINNQGNAQLFFAYSDAVNTFEGDISARNTGNGYVRFRYFSGNSDINFAHNLILSSTQDGRIRFMEGGGKLNLNGTTNQTIDYSGIAGESRPAHVYRLNLNNLGGQVFLNTNLEIIVSIEFTNGKVKTTGTHGLLIFDEDATYTGVTNTKYVSGKIQKKGSVSFVFPVGSDTQYRPLATNVTSCSAPVTVYFVVGPEPTGLAPPACYEIATCEHWVVNSDNSVITFNVAVNITGSCVDPLPSSPLVAWFDKTQWSFLDATVQPVDMLTAIPTVTTVPNSVQSGDHYVTIGSKLSLPGGNVMTGSASVCQNTSQIYSVPSAPNTTYSWKLPIGWSIASSNPNSHQITVTVASNAPVGTQTIAVYPSQVANCEFCELDPITLEVTVNAQPNVGSVVGPTTAKAGQSNMTYSVTNTTGADEFVWTLPAGVAENGSGATGTITTTVPYITVDFVTGFAGGNINVYGTSTTCGNGPTVSMFVSLCTTCRTSNATLPDNLKNNHLTVFPNPIMGSEKIKVQIEGQTEVSVVNIVIVDEKGAKVKTFVQELQNGLVEIPGQSLAPGKYLLRIQVGSEIVGKKILKY